MSNILIEGGISLSYLTIGDVYQKNLVIFLHGIMGNKRNLSAFARKFVESNPNTAAILFDLRNHGESTKGARPLTIEACARDIELALHAVKLQPFAFVGHSFGAKVALLAAQKFAQTKCVFLLDASPSAQKFGASTSKNGPLSSLELIDLLIDTKWPVPTRRALVESLATQGVSNSISTWMTTNLVTTNGGFRLVFDPSDIRSMLESFLAADLWPLVGEVGVNTQVHLVAAAQGNRLFKVDEEKLKKLLALNGFFHVLENAGHFLQSDNPLGLLEIMKKYFQ